MKGAFAFAASAAAVAIAVGGASAGGQVALAAEQGPAEPRIKVMEIQERENLTVGQLAQHGHLELSKFTWVRERLDAALAEKARQEEEARLAAEYEELMAYYAEQGYYSGGGGGGGMFGDERFRATDLASLLGGQGNTWDDNGYTYTWYHNDIGWGNIEDRVPGIHYVDEVAYDGDGYIVVAGSSYNPDEPPVEVDTAYGPARIYDSGSPGGNLDIYTNR